MKTGDVILYTNTHPSHSWGNGLYIIIKWDIKHNEAYLCILNNKGEPQTSKDGKYVQSITGIKDNSFITKTNLSYKLKVELL